MVTRRLLAMMLVPAAIAFAQCASAADMSVAAPITKAPVARIYDWTGFYIGVNAGIGLGRDLATNNRPSDFQTSYLMPQGGLGGVQAGYNWQTGSLVLGIEADIQAAAMKDDFTCSLGCGPLTARTSVQSLDWFGTARGRIGLALGPVLTYATAGYAYGSVKTTIVESDVGVSVFQTSKTRGGWSYGGGIEAALGGNWTGKIEYLALDLGGSFDRYTSQAVFVRSTSNDVREHIFRAGLNYRLGAAGTLAPPPTANWAGFYIGGNLGAATARERSVNDVSFNSTERFNLSPRGFIGGIQAGYNWQAANWVFGVEADIQGSNQRDDKSCVAFCANDLSGYRRIDATSTWLGTARGRLGYSLGSTLFYGTGGVAYGDLRHRITHLGMGRSDAQLESTRSGWTVGAGIESPLTLLGANWTAKTEYLYVDLGSASQSYQAFDPLSFSPPGVFTGRLQEHIFRTGLNYHINAPVMARY